MKNKKQYLIYGCIALVGVAIAVTAILWKQSFLRVLPLFVSLVIAYLQSKANRFAPLLGGVNSVLYAVAYAYYRLYGSMAYALLFSFPLQLVTFFRWRKNKWNGTTKFQSMTWKQRGLLAGGVLIVWAGTLLVLRAVGASYSLLDSTTTILGILITFLTLFAYIEYSVLMIPSALISMILYVTMLKENPEQITYLIYSVYGLVCQCVAYFSVRKAYREQQDLEKA